MSGPRRGLIIGFNRKPYLNGMSHVRIHSRNISCNVVFAQKYETPAGVFNFWGHVNPGRRAKNALCPGLLFDRSAVWALLRSAIVETPRWGVSCSSKHHFCWRRPTGPSLQMSKVQGKALPFRWADSFSVRGCASQVPRRSLGFLWSDSRRKGGAFPQELAAKPLSVSDSFA